MIKLLIDTCVWLDLAKDHRQQVLLSALEALSRERQVTILLPDIVRDEFERNKARIVEESGRSLSSVIKRVKDAISQFGNSANAAIVLAELNELDHRIGTHGEAVHGSTARVEALFATALRLPTTETAKLRAANRALGRRAPFHRQRNGIDDAVLIEIYADLVAMETDPNVQFAFITHNTKDFSDTVIDNRKPHSDIAACFSPNISRYAISLAEVLNDAAPELLEEFKFELEWAEEPRRHSEILGAIDELLDKVWYNRHWNRRIDIERGRIKLVEKETLRIKDHRKRPIQRDVWEQALKAAKQVEDRYGVGNLGPWSDFEWGTLSGKLSALRWVLGDEWDNLDT